MDQDRLVERQIDEGWQLVDDLAAAGFDVTAACWAREGDEDRWFLWVVSRAVDRLGLRDAYLALILEERKTPRRRLDVFAIKLLSPSALSARDLVEFRDRYPTLWPGWIGSQRLGKGWIREGYLYPAPTEAREGPAVLPVVEGRETPA